VPEIRKNPGHFRVGKKGDFVILTFISRTTQIGGAISACFSGSGIGMTITTPKHRATLWIIANLALLTFIPSSALYYTRMLNAGAYPVDADSISIPILEVAVSVLVLLVPLNVIFWLHLRRYPGRVPIRLSTEGTGGAARLVAAFGLALACLSALAAISVLFTGEIEDAPVLLLWPYVALAMRAAFLTSVKGTVQDARRAADTCGG